MSCKEDEVSYVNKPSFTKTCGWSDQCHFTTKEDYKEVLAIIGDRKIPPEFVMNRRAYSKKNCKHWGAHFYGNLTEGPFIQHVNGRFIKNDALEKIKDENGKLPVIKAALSNSTR